MHKGWKEGCMKGGWTRFRVCGPVRPCSPSLSTAGLWGSLSLFRGRPVCCGVFAAPLDSKCTLLNYDSPQCLQPLPDVSSGIGQEGLAPSPSSSTFSLLPESQERSFGLWPGTLRELQGAPGFAAVLYFTRYLHPAGAGPGPPRHGRQSGVRRRWAVRHSAGGAGALRRLRPRGASRR